MEVWHRWAEAELEQAVHVDRAEHQGAEAQVWRLSADDRPLAYLKQHRTSDKWRRETTLLQRLAEPPGAPVPPLLAHRETDGLLLLGPLPGDLASTRTWAPSQRRSLHEQAGRFRRRLDAVPVDDDDPTPLPEAIARRHRAWCERARPYLSPALQARVERGLDPSCFEGAPRRWCHRDLAPHNWIVSPSPTGLSLSVIDFGQARPDAWLVDVLKLWDREWAEQPDLADAFWAGYGRRPTPREQRQLLQLAVLHGLATTTWALRHGDRALAEHGHAVLDRALGEVEQ